MQPSTLTTKIIGKRLRIYLGEWGNPHFLDVIITIADQEKLLEAGKASFDDGGILFTELVYNYPNSRNTANEG